MFFSRNGKSSYEQPLNENLSVWVDTMTLEYIQTIVCVFFLACYFLQLKAHYFICLSSSCGPKNQIKKLCNNFPSYEFGMFDHSRVKFFKVWFRLQRLKIITFWRLGNWWFWLILALFFPKILYEKIKRWLKLLIFIY